MKTMFTTMRFSVVNLVVVQSLVLVKSWDLTSRNISSDYFVSSAAVFLYRAFLTLPRTSCHNSVTYPTLIQVPWSGYELPQVTVRTASLEYPPHVAQTWDNCDEVQNAISVDVEPPGKARLWVLDSGSSKCPAKLIVYNLYMNSELQRCVLPYKGLSFVAVDTEGPRVRAYVGGQENSLIIYEFEENKWSKLLLQTTEGSNIPTKYLAISKVDQDMYCTGTKEREIFSMDLAQIRNHTDTIPANCTNITVQDVGMKLGPSAGLITDLKGGLNYYLTRDYAIVRWNTKLPMIAENHYVLAQSYNALAYVPHMFEDSLLNIWTLVSSPEDCKLENQIALRTRCVKILQHFKNGANSSLTLVDHS